ncbi:MAG: hypothetical protein ABWZ40_00960 [Caulobacterales bacterium]
MFTWLERAPAVVHSTAMAPLLPVVAGDFARAIAQLWPAPHRPFMEAPAARRHLIAIVLDALDVRDDAIIPEAPSLGRALERESAKRLTRRFLPDAAEGLPRALHRLGEIAWTGPQYRTLLRLLKDADTAKILRHAEALDPGVIMVLEMLPPPLRHGRIPYLLARPETAALAAEAFEAVRMTRGAEEIQAVAERWRRAETAGRLLAMATDDLIPSRFQATPFPEHPDLLHLSSAQAFEETGRRFRNCLATYAMRAAAGDLIVYEWAGPPPAVLAITRDPVWGWRLEEARITDNDPIPHDARITIARIMAHLGVAVERGGYALASVLDWAARDPERAATPWSDSEIFGY